HGRRAGRAAGERLALGAAIAGFRAAADPEALRRARPAVLKGVRTLFSLARPDLAFHAGDATAAEPGGVLLFPDENAAVAAERAALPRRVGALLMEDRGDGEVAAAAHRVLRNAVRRREGAHVERR